MNEQRNTRGNEPAGLLERRAANRIKWMTYGRFTIFFIAGYIVLRAFFYDWYTALFLTDRAIALGVTFLLATIFIVLGIWAKKKPFTALLIALVLSCLLYFADIIHDPSNFFKQRSIVMLKNFAYRIFRVIPAGR
jgi:uncharacterized membrane protein YqaE (UPF0057 family)